MLASPSKCDTCRIAIHTDSWDWFVSFRRLGGTLSCSHQFCIDRGRIAFGWNQNQVRSLARQFSVNHDLLGGWPKVSVPAAGNNGPAAISARRRWTRKFGGRWIQRRASSDLEFAGRRRSFHPRASRENNRKRLINPTYHFVADFAEVGG